MGLVPTRLTSELGLGEPVGPVDVPTGRAPLGTVAGVHCNHDATSVLGFIRDELQELSPPGVGDEAVEPDLAAAPLGS
jgi:hypothetical protein